MVDREKNIGQRDNDNHSRRDFLRTTGKVAGVVSAVELLQEADAAEFSKKSPRDFLRENLRQPYHSPNEEPSTMKHIERLKAAETSIRRFAASSGKEMASEEDVKQSLLLLKNELELLIKEMMSPQDERGGSGTQARTRFEVVSELKKYPGTQMLMQMIERYEIAPIFE